MTRLGSVVLIVTLWFGAPLWAHPEQGQIRESVDREARRGRQLSSHASEDYQAILETRGITCSMSRRGNCYDNAVMESVFSTVTSELRDRFDSCGKERRRHSALGQISPAAFGR